MDLLVLRKLCIPLDHHLSQHLKKHQNLETPFSLISLQHSARKNIFESLFSNFLASKFCFQFFRFVAENNSLEMLEMVLLG